MGGFPNRSTFVTPSTISESSLVGSTRTGTTQQANGSEDLSYRIEPLFGSSQPLSGWSSHGLVPNATSAAMLCEEANSPFPPHLAEPEFLIFEFAKNEYVPFVKIWLMGDATTDPVFARIQYY
eukprot:Filipodium_phascolosomae@DN7192_c0_g1_i1.p1